MSFSTAIGSARRRLSDHLTYIPVFRPTENMACEDFERRWSMRKGHRHLLESEKGRATFAHSIGRKWLRRQHDCEVPPEELPKKRSAESRKSGKSQKNADHWLSGRALDWEHVDVEPFWFDSEVECEETWSEASWDFSRQSTTGSVSSLETLPSEPETRPTAERWEEAQAVAKRMAQKYRPPPRPPAREVNRPVKPTPVAEPEDGVISCAPRLDGRPLGAGAPPPELEPEHDRVLSFAKPQTTEQLRAHGEAKGRARLVRECNRGKGPKPDVREQVISPKSDEYDAVTRYFQATLGHETVIQSLTRINVPKFHERFLTNGDNTIMFHGCRTAQNEASILANGFRVSSCVSGGMRFGTWFAYKADYSNIGYAFQDPQGWKHLFVCVVSYYHTVMDQMQMRVVGQNCAIPQWLIRYRTVPPPTSVLRSPPPVTLPTKSAHQGSERTWYVVRDGKWELEGT